MKILKIIDSIMHFFVHGFFRTLATVILKVFYWVKPVNEKNVPKKGGFLIMPNHTSYWDPPLVGAATWRRPFRYMARSTLFIPVWGWFLKWMGAIPIKRGKVDRNAWGALVDNVKEGNPVVFFPEGTRSPDGEIKDGKPGTGMLVYNAKAKVLPVYIHNSAKAWPKGSILPGLFIKIYVVYGEIIDFEDYFNREPSKELYIEITERIMKEIKALRDDFKAKLKEKKNPPASGLRRTG